MDKKNKIIIANWKMELGFKESLALALEMKNMFSGFSKGGVVICPDFISLSEVGKELTGSIIKLGAQDVFWEEKGAYTGEVSSSELEEVGCEYVIIGHSERRGYLKEDYSLINKELKNLLKESKLIPILCIGEKKESRESGKVEEVLSEQLRQALEGVSIKDDSQIIVAYEPLWAIGSGLVIKPEDMNEVNKIIVQSLSNIFNNKIAENNFLRIYGGSVNSGNVKDFAQIEGLDGLLVGGASLNSDEFYKMADKILI
ncbi:triose-phosphate isomerase [bacterium]|nr:triose-phosphate isomerase [bacterium]